ncbi:ExbD/TolR family protein [Paracoccus aurantiacus]|nr:biopolymer transporter ExbD [Paracoccus aurantiacus]
MTSLADVMFQLLIFFMLSANIAPYSMIDVRTGAVSGGSNTPAGTPETEAGPGQITDIRTTAVWTLDADGAIRASGQLFSPDRLDALAAALLAQGTDDVLVVLRRDVSVQRLVTVLQTLAAHGITSVQIANGGL